jgi:hypothetical protein
MVYSPARKTGNMNRKLLIAVSLANLILVALLVSRVYRSTVTRAPYSYISITPFQPSNKYEDLGFLILAS